MLQYINLHKFLFLKFIEHITLTLPYTNTNKKLIYAHVNARTPYLTLTHTQICVHMCESERVHLDLGTKNIYIYLSNRN